MDILLYLLAAISTIFQVIAVVIIIRIIVGAVIKNQHSNWNHLVEGLKFSAQEFYSHVEKEIKSHDIGMVKFKHIQLKEGGYFSAKRIYLRVEYKQLIYDVCFAPFATGSFISWHLLHKTSIWEIIIAKIPIIGPWLRDQLFPVTYYKTDTASMFMTYCQSSVMKVIDNISKENGVRSLTEDERKPVLNSIFKR